MHGGPHRARAAFAAAASAAWYSNCAEADARSAPPPANDGALRACVVIVGDATIDAMMRHPDTCTSTSQGHAAISASDEDTAPSENALYAA